jgi:hypothetical protein
MAGKLYVGDFRTFIIVDTKVDLTGAINLALRVKKPDGTLVVWSPVIIHTVNFKKYLRYTVGATDFDQAGEYEIQAYAEVPQDGTFWEGHGETAKFVVYDRFN